MSGIEISKVNQLFIARHAGEVMQPVAEVSLRAGVGIHGDRYGEGVGRFTHSKRKTIRQISLISLEAFEEANSEAEAPFTLGETRRNIVTTGVELNCLVDMVFWIGPVALRGVELCTPCAVPSTLSGKPGFLTAFKDRGGLRAEVLEDGIIRVSDEVRKAR